MFLSHILKYYGPTKSRSKYQNLGLTYLKIAKYQLVLIMYWQPLQLSLRLNATHTQYIPRQFSVSYSFQLNGTISLFRWLKIIQYSQKLYNPYQFRLYANLIWLKDSNFINSSKRATNCVRTSNKLAFALDIKIRPINQSTMC